MVRALVVIPTLDEADNIAPLLRRVRDACPQCDVLVVDDASRDGTAEIVEELALELGGIEVLHRPRRSGLGSAYRDGFFHGLDRGYEVLVSMDADFSHDPAILPTLIGSVTTDGVGLAIGSRYVPGGTIKNWPPHRRGLSKYGNLYASLLLSVGVTDMTSGYRAYRADSVSAMYRDPIRARGYGALIEMAYRVALSDRFVVEVPITFVDRTEGRSKMSPPIAIETLWHVTRMGVERRTRPLWKKLKGERDLSHLPVE